MNDLTIGNPDYTFLIAGPCAIESTEQLELILNSSNPPKIVRGGIFKMRTNKNSFQGLNEKGIDIIKELKRRHDFHFVTEVSDPRQIEKVSSITSMFQVGARSMYNYELLKELELLKKPVILKRAFSATIDEWLGAAEYLKGLGDQNIILCERGIRSFDHKLRNMLDLGSVIYLKKNAPYPVIVDPSHAMGNSQYVIQASLAALAAGADGLIVEVHPNPEMAMSDGQQSLSLPLYRELVEKCSKLSLVLNKKLQV